VTAWQPLPGELDALAVCNCDMPASIAQALGLSIVPPPTFGAAVAVLIVERDFVAWARTEYKGAGSPCPAELLAARTRQTRAPDDVAALAGLPAGRFSDVAPRLLAIVTAQTAEGSGGASGGSSSRSSSSSSDATAGSAPDGAGETGDESPELAVPDGDAMQVEPT